MTQQGSGKRGRPAVYRNNRRDDIIEAAARLFAEEGYNAVSLVDIAHSVGLSKTALYHYFDRKEEILGTIVVATVQKLSEHVDRAVSGRTGAKQRLIAFMEAQAEFFEQHQAPFQILLTRVANLQERHMRDVAIEWRVNYENTIRNIVRDGLASGEFQARDPSAVVRAIISSVYWLARWYRPNGKQTAREIAREYAEIYLYGIARSGTPPAPPP
ncbi:TetR/AcrR family transcriptional regulator [Candidimonas nitroreducens]|uniref:TetR family transcriptional regulator n=1 Tax=Candidimonas nitroreducens TaxID=683354 RepID=A0A225MH77_9BURK|nr:TetR/AcrR family transcriptional regulator [Candidimonas nitroreducens]OWT60594.1 TetR family transcriptional regulator [Candidimonas nitroreducens]